MTLTLNPLMGNLCSTYAVKAGRNAALCSRFDFNFYSYESDVQLGLELWRRALPSPDVAWARERIARSSFGRPDGWEPPILHAEGEMHTAGETHTEEEVSGVLKAKVDQRWRIGILWEGRIKELLFTLGASFDLRKREQIFRGLGLEVAYSS